MHERTEIRRPLVYIYLDPQGLESLYAQTVDRLEVELVRSQSKQGGTEVGAKVGFGNWLFTLLGLKEAGAEAKVQSTRGQIEESKTRLSVEHKLELLSSHLLETKQCFKKLDEAVGFSSTTGDGVYIRILERFDAPDFYAGGGEVNAINSSQAMVFKIENRKYDPSDSYFKRDPFSIVMTAGLRNFTRLKGSMGATSHEAFRFRALNGKAIPLGVFGYLLRAGNLVYQIKPYAIWM
jgi:hypothetical protein